DPFQIQRRDCESIGSEADVHSQLLAHAAQAERRAAQESERSGDLRDDQAVTQPRPFPIRPVAGFRILERVEGLETGRAQRREEAETDAHEQQAADGKKEEPQVQTWMEIRPTPPSCELR